MINGRMKKWSGHLLAEILICTHFPNECLFFKKGERKREEEKKTSWAKDMEVDRCANKINHCCSQKCS
jgi:hypothetical protein